MMDEILAGKIERVRLAAGNNQFTIRLCGELAEICHLASDSDAREERIRELEGESLFRLRLNVNIAKELHAVQAENAKLREALEEKLEAPKVPRPAKTIEDFADALGPVTAWAFYETFERRHCGTGWLRAQMGQIEFAFLKLVESLTFETAPNTWSGNPLQLGRIRASTERARQALAGKEQV